MIRTAKRSFRRQASEARPAYPTLDAFDRDRRGFILQLGAAVLGGSVLGALAGCGHRYVPADEPDLGTIEGKPQAPDARVDNLAGSTDAENRKWPKPDAPVLEGDVAGPDARIDEADMDPGPSPPGSAPHMSARLDGS